MKRIATGTARVVNGRIVEDSRAGLAEYFGSARSTAMTGGVIAGALIAAGLAYWIMQPPGRATTASMATADAAGSLSATRSDVGAGSGSIATPEKRVAGVPNAPVITATAPRITSLAPNELPTADAIASAVQDSIGARKQEAKADQTFVAALRADLAKRTQPQESPKGMLDQLSTDKTKLAQHNRDVMNRVHVDTDPKRAASDADNLRNSLQEIVRASVEKAKPAASDASLVAALQPEVQTRGNETRTIVVQSGDTLSGIAERVYGDPMKFMRIFDANPRVLTSPHHLFIGMVLRVPT